MSRCSLPIFLFFVRSEKTKFACVCAPPELEPLHPQKTKSQPARNMSQKRPAGEALGGSAQKASRPAVAALNAWHTDNRFVGRRILRGVVHADGSRSTAWAVVTAWLPEHLSNYENSQGKKAALWRVVYDADAVGEEDLEEGELTQAMSAADREKPGSSFASMKRMHEAPSGGGSPQPSAPARTVGSGGCASSASAAGPPAFPEAPGAILQIVKRRNDAELAATTFEKKRMVKELFRCYFQAWNPENPWDNETHVWTEMVEDTNKVMITSDVGIIISPFIDPQFTTFSLAPVGAAGTPDPSIRDYDGCGVRNLPAGTTMQWQFDHLVQYTCGDVKVCFLVVKVPGTPPPTVWHPHRKAKPEVQTTADVEKLVRAKFYIAPGKVLTTPSWFGASIVENERSMWKWAFVATERKYTTLFNQYSDCSTQMVGLRLARTELQKENDTLKEKLARMERDSQLTTQALKDINEAIVCTNCLDIFDDNAPAMLSSCGHALHKKCYEGQKPTMKDKCQQCNVKTKPSWNSFTGYTAIATALKKLQTERDAQ